jgi:hypothetical protein
METCTSQIDRKEVSIFQLWQQAKPIYSKREGKKKVNDREGTAGAPLVSL